MGRFPGQFLRRTELIKRSLRQDDEPTRWCLKPLQAGAHAAPPAAAWPSLLLKQHDKAPSAQTREPCRPPAGPREVESAWWPVVAAPPAAPFFWVDPGLLATDTGHPFPPGSRGGPFPEPPRSVPAATARNPRLPNSEDVLCSANSVRRYGASASHARICDTPTASHSKLHSGSGGAP